MFSPFVVPYTKERIVGGCRRDVSFGFGKGGRGWMCLSGEKDRKRGDGSVTNVTDGKTSNLNYSKGGGDRNRNDHEKDLARRV